jgi:hypothetical protein
LKSTLVYYTSGIVVVNAKVVGWAPGKEYEIIYVSNGNWGKTGASNVLGIYYFTKRYSGLHCECIPRRLELWAVRSIPASL